MIEEIKLLYKGINVILILWVKTLNHFGSYELKL